VIGGTWAGLQGLAALGHSMVGLLTSAASPIVASLTGVGVWRRTIGGLTGALIGMGIPQYEASSRRAREGSASAHPFTLTIPLDEAG